jgi:hypothetical protein
MATLTPEVVRFGPDMRGVRGENVSHREIGGTRLGRRHRK